ncbi:8496_t:CDS:2 [Funneliformis caledonium]|uniref:8496_t:CDS:1 n=1 Tax=Funneliformis caledonium TaxID=1117310 RepID=A0A9N9EY50_9GLOM|nr:8496_t:CDS:2 [Funneliformis caledonium]
MDKTNNKRKKENSSIIWDYYFEEYDEEEKQLYLVCQDIFGEIIELIKIIQKS